MTISRWDESCPVQFELIDLNRIVVIPSYSNLKSCVCLYVRCDAKNLKNNSSTKQESVPENNVLLKVAWYGSKLLGIVDSLLRSPTTTETKAPEEIAELSSDGWSGVVDGPFNNT
nr:uncharacterized protein LOC109155859 [Ipomoea trifida]